MEPGGRLALPCQPYRGCESPTILAWHEVRCRQHLTNTNWGRRRYSKSHAPYYRYGAFPLKLLRHLSPRAGLSTLTRALTVERRRPAIRRSSPKGRVGLEPTPPAAWSGLSDSNRCRQTGSLPSWPLDETRQAWSGRRYSKPLRRVGGPGTHVAHLCAHARVSHRLSKS